MKHTGIETGAASQFVFLSVRRSSSSIRCLNSTKNTRSHIHHKINHLDGDLTMATTGPLPTPTPATTPSGVTGERDKFPYKCTVDIAFPTEREAEIVKNVMDVDQEIGDRVQRQLSIADGPAVEGSGDNIGVVLRV